MYPATLTHEQFAAWLHEQPETTRYDLIADGADPLARCLTHCTRRPWSLALNVAYTTIPLPTDDPQDRYHQRSWPTQRHSYPLAAWQIAYIDALCRIAFDKLLDRNTITQAEALQALAALDDATPAELAS